MSTALQSVDASNSNLNVGAEIVAKLNATYGVTLPKLPYFFGQLSDASNSTGVIPISEVERRNITHDTVNHRLTPLVAGVYCVHAQQLVKGTASSYLMIRKSGVTQMQAYYRGGDVHVDLQASWIGYLSTTDYIDVYRQDPVATSWDGGHSAVCMHLVG